MKTIVFALALLAPLVHAGEFDAYLGSYELAPGCIVDIGPMDEAGGQLVFLEHPSLRIGVLQAKGSERFTAGPALMQAEPVAVDAKFERDARSGVVQGLAWTQDGTTLEGRRVVAPIPQAVSVRHAGIELKGVLQRPAGAGPHPAIVFAHGSGDAGRNVGVWNAWFVRQGFAVLSLDKRGVGESSGDWHAAGIDDIAGDWLAGVAWLKRQPDIDRKRIGVHASSQGGWTAPRMAARSKDIAFLVVRAGSALPVLDTMAYEVRHSVREAGFDEAQATQAEAAARELFALAARRAPWSEFSAAAAQYAKQPWADAAWPVGMTEAGWGREWVALNANFDNAQDLARIDIPVLWFLAEHDHNVDSAASAAKLRAAGIDDLTLVEIHDAGHAFTATKTGTQADVGAATHMAAGYWDAMARWLRERGFSGNASGR